MLCSCCGLECTLIELYTGSVVSVVCVVCVLWLECTLIELYTGSVMSVVCVLWLECSVRETWGETSRQKQFIKKHNCYFNIKMEML